MSTHHPSFVEITTLHEAEKQIRKIGSDPQSIGIMAPKAVSKVVRMEHVILQDAIIIKQDMLSLGGEVAIPQDSFELKERAADILIMGTVKQLRDLVGKLKRHYPRIRSIASDLEFLLKKLR